MMDKAIIVTVFIEKLEHHMNYTIKQYIIICYATQIFTNIQSSLITPHQSDTLMLTNIILTHEYLGGANLLTQ